MSDNEPARAGATISVGGDEGALGYLPERFAKQIEPNTIGARAMAAKAQAEEVVRGYHNLNRVYLEAKAKGQDPSAALPDPRVQLQQFQSDTAAVAKLEADVQLLEIEHMRAGETLQPYRPSKDMLDFAKNEELRRTFSRMSADQRALAIERPSYRRAILETEGEASGITPGEHEILREASLRVLQPGALERREVERLALDAMKQSLSTAKAALRAASVRLGQNKPSPKPTPPDKWR
jgi:hypothetical protein